ncbi:MAG: hypothetical protein ACUVQG_11895 [Thermogutta sp.]
MLSSFHHHFVIVGQLTAFVRVASVAVLLYPFTPATPLRDSQNRLTE